MSHRVLITGVAGFIGSNLASRLLQAGHTVVGIDNLAYGLKRNVPAGVRFHRIDIRSTRLYRLFQSGDTVFHLAAKNCLADCQKDPLETADINVTGTVNVFEAACRAKVKKIIYAESSAIYEDRASSFYALSKQCDNLFAGGFQKAFGLSTVGLRYFNVYGPGQDYRRTSPPVMSRFIINLLTGKPVILYEDDDVNRRDFVYVDDINEFHLHCLTDNRVNNRVFDLGSGRSYAIAEIYNLLKKLIGERVTPQQRPRLTDDPPVATRAAITPARQLGWRPRVSLRQGLEAMVEYLKGELEHGYLRL